MEQVISSLISKSSSRPQDFCLTQDMVGGEELLHQQSPATGGGKSLQRRSSKRLKLSNYWIKKKMETLSLQLHPVPLKPLLLDIGAYEVLLKSLGLWDFLNFRFDGDVRRDLLTELVASYKYNPKKYKGVGLVHGVGVSLSRGAVASALHLPAERIHGKAKGVSFSVEQGFFIEKLLWDWMVMKDDGDDERMDFVLNFAEDLKHLRLERADWAGLIWYMVDRELKKGKNLVNCYYASHLQALLKHQRPELFEDNRGGEEAGSPDNNSGKEIVDVGSGDGVESGLSGSLLKRCCKREREFRDKNVVGDDEWERLRKLHFADSAGREIGDDVHQMEVGNLKGVCKSDTVSAGCEVGCVVVDLPCLAGGESVDDDKLKEGGILEGVCHSDMVDSLVNKEKVLPDLQANVDKEIPASGCEIEDEINEVECKTSTIEEEDVNQSEANVVVKEDGENEKESDVKEVKESEASFEAEVGNFFDVRCVNEAGGTEHKENESLVERGANLEQDQHQSELRLENSIEENEESRADFASGEVNCLVVDSDDSYTHEVHDKDAEKEDSTDGLLRQEIEHQSVDMEDDAVPPFLTQGKHQPELATEKNSESVADFVGREGKADDLVYQVIENQTVDAGSCQANSGKELGLGIANQEEDEQVDVEICSGGSQLRLAQTRSNTGDDAMATLANQTPEENIGHKEQKFHNTQIDLSDEEFQDPFEQLETDDGNMDLLLQAGGDHMSLGQLPFDTDMPGCSFGTPDQYMQEAGTDNMIEISEEHADCSFGGQEADTDDMIGTSEEHDEESMDLDHCAEKMKFWTTKFIDSACRKVKKRLQKKIKEQKQIIQQQELMLQKERQEKQQYELMLQKEQQQKQQYEFMLQKETQQKQQYELMLQKEQQQMQQYEFMLQKERQQKQQCEVMLQKERQQKKLSDHKYNRELYFMQSALEDYKKAFQQTNSAFAKYRERAQLPEEPLYMPHPDGGGKVILVSEWKQLEKERQKMAMKAVVEEPKTMDE